MCYNIAMINLLEKILNETEYDGLVEHFYGNSKPKWVSDKKLSQPWSYLSKYEDGNYLPELKERGIYAI